MGARLALVMLSGRLTVWLTDWLAAAWLALVSAVPFMSVVARPP